MEGRSIDGMKCVSAGGKDWLLVTLNDGVLLVLNFYGGSLDNFKNFGLPIENIIKLSRMLKVGDIIFSLSDLITDKAGDDAVFVTSDSGTTMLRFDYLDGSMKASKIRELEGFELVVSGRDKGAAVGLTLDRSQLVILEIREQEHFLHEVNGFSRTIQKFDYIKEEDLLCLCSFDSSTTVQPHLPQFQIVRASTGRVVYS